MIVNMGFVDMGADDIGVIALGEPLGQLERFASSGVISPGTKDCRKW